MRRIVVSCVVVALAVSAPAARAQSVSFSGSFTGTVSQGPGRCPAPRVTVTAITSGFVTPFGAASGTQSACAMLGDPNVTDGLFTLMFGGGGTLFGTFVGTFVPIGPQMFTSTATLTITGGTGRFADATGGGTTTGTQNLAAGGITSQVTGQVSAPGLVPEPSTLALLAGGLASAVGVGRVRRRGGAPVRSA